MITDPSLWRPVTILGVEVLSLGAEFVGACTVVVMGAVHPLALLAGLGFAAGLHAAALAAGRVDPRLPGLYLRSLRHPDSLPARPRLGARPRRPAVSVPGR
jgi:type IV secretory pathway TrbD component